MESVDGHESSPQRPHGDDPFDPNSRPRPPGPGETIDWWAMLVADVGTLVRNGHVVRGALVSAHVASGYDSAFFPLYDQLIAEGYSTEVAILRLTREQPRLLRLLRRASLTGWIGSAIALVAFLYPLWIFAALPGMATRAVVTELCIWVTARDALAGLAADDRALARTLFDLSIYSTRGRRQLAMIEAVALAVGGVGVYALILATRANLQQPFLTMWTAGGVVAVVAGALAIRAIRRLGRSGLRPPPKQPVAPPPTIAVDILSPGLATSDSESGSVTPRPIAPAFLDMVGVLSFARPRLVFAGFTSLMFGLSGTMAIASQTPEGYVLGFPSVLVAAVVLARAVQTKVLIGPHGIVDIGVVRTRRYGWDDVVALRLVPEPRGHLESIHLIEAGGRDRLLLPALAVAGARPDLARVCEVVTAIANGSEPPPPPARTTPLPPSVAAIFLLLGFGGLAGLVGLAALLGEANASIAIVAVPAGREYSRFQLADGTLSPARIKCPSVAQWIAGNNDPLCPSAIQTQGAVAALLIGTALAMLGPAMWLALKRRRMRRINRVDDAVGVVCDR